MCLQSRVTEIVHRVKAVLSKGSMVLALNAHCISLSSMISREQIQDWGGGETERLDNSQEVSFDTGYC